MNEAIDFQENIEIIDNEKINEALCILEEKCDNAEAIRNITAIETRLKEQMPDSKMDIDLAYDSINQKYYFVSEKEGFKSNIPMNVDEIHKYGEILIKYLTATGHSFSDKVLQLSGNMDRRIVTANTTPWGGIANDSSLYVKDVRNESYPEYQNNITEELYKFAVNLRGEEYDVSRIYPNGEAKNKGQEDFGIPENNITNAIDFEITEANNYSDYAILAPKNSNLYDLIDEKISKIQLPIGTQASIREYMNQNMMYFGTIDEPTEISLQTFSNEVRILGYGETITFPIKDVFQRNHNGRKVRSGAE